MLGKKAAGRSTDPVSVLKASNKQESNQVRFAGGKSASYGAGGEGADYLVKSGNGKGTGSACTPASMALSSKRKKVSPDNSQRV